MCTPIQQTYSGKLSYTLYGLTPPVMTSHLNSKNTILKLVSSEHIILLVYSTKSSYVKYNIEKQTAKNKRKMTNFVCHYISYFSFIHILPDKVVGSIIVKRWRESTSRLNAK